MYIYIYTCLYIYIRVYIYIYIYYIVIICAKYMDSQSVVISLLTKCNNHNFVRHHWCEKTKKYSVSPLILLMH